MEMEMDTEVWVEVETGREEGERAYKRADHHSGHCPLAWAE